MGWPRWGRDTTYAGFLFRYLVPVALSCFALGVLTAESPGPPAPRTRVIVQKVISAADLARLEALAEALTTPTTDPLSPADAAAVERAVDAVESVESGDVMVTPTPPTTAPPSPPPAATTTTTVEPGGDREHVYDYVPPTTTTP